MMLTTFLRCLDNLVDLGLWSNAEPVTGLLCCSFLTYGPFIQKTRARMTKYTMGSGISTTQKQLVGSMGYKRHWNSDEYQLNSVESGTHAQCSTVDQTPVNEADDSIHVQQAFAVRQYSERKQ
jgi:hypothetical protein